MTAETDVSRRIVRLAAEAANTGTASADSGDTRSAKAPVRVLVLVAANSIEAGPIKGCIQFIRHLSGPDLDFRLVNFRRPENDSGPARFSAAAADVGIHVDFLTQHGRGYLDLARALDAYVRDARIDVIQSHGFKPAVLCALLRLRRRIPWVCFGHGATAENWRVRAYNAAESLAQVCADRIVLVAEAQRRRPWQRLMPRRTRVVHNAVDVSAPVATATPPDEVRAALGLRRGDRLAVAVGRFSPEKGLDVLLDALALDTDPPDGALNVALVGAGPERDALEARVRRLHLQGRVTFVDHTPTPGDYLRAADVVVLPSRSEGIPNVALEAMALGRPLVATAVGGTPEVVVDGRTGILVPAGDAPALAQAVRRVLTEPGLAERLGREGRAHAERALSVDVRCSQLRAIYAELVPRLAGATARSTAETGDGEQRA